MVKKIAAVVDSTCLIGLERIGRLDLLPALLDPIFVPLAVANEFGSRPLWMTPSAVRDGGMVAALRLVVDLGEAEAITLAHEKGLRIILDDRKAREAAQRLGVPVTGTVGLLLKAKREGLVPAIRPLMDALAEHQFRIANSLYAEALRLAGESS